MKKDLLLNLINNPENLPSVAVRLLPSDRKTVIGVVKNEKGYRFLETKGSEEEAEEYMNILNAAMEVSEEQAEALMLLSMRQED